jgi:hypothetical protein
VKAAGRHNQVDSDKDKRCQKDHNMEKDTTYFQRPYTLAEVSTEMELVGKDVEFGRINPLQMPTGINIEGH